MKYIVLKNKNEIRGCRWILENFLDNSAVVQAPDLALLDQRIKDVTAVLANFNQMRDPER